MNSFLIFVFWSVLFVAVFVGLFKVVTSILHSAARLSKDKILEDKGDLINDSGWGSAFINYVRAIGCAKLLEYERGYVLKLMPLMGGGHMWIPKGEIKITNLDRKRPMERSRHKVIEFRGHHIKLMGRLARLVQ